MDSTLAKRPVVGFCVAVCLAIPAATASAAETESAIEEVTVTAQRIEESVQDVPIAVTALTDNILADRQVINPSDLQLNAPNVSFTATNFGGSSFGIRGIGNLVIGRTGESGVSHALERDRRQHEPERVGVLRHAARRGSCAVPKARCTVGTRRAAQSTS